MKSLILSLISFKKNGGDFNFRIIADNERGISKLEKETLRNYIRFVNGDIEYKNFKSNTKSYQYTITSAIKSNINNICFLVEDDYLFTKDAVGVLYKAYSDLNCDYLTPYDHPVRYEHDFYLGADLPHWENKMFLSGEYHFRSQESTCMTFMASDIILNEDEDIHRRFSLLGSKCPNDRELFRCLQHLGTYSFSTRPKRLLLGPIPSVATHSHKDYLAPCIDWNKIAQRILSNNSLIC